MRLSHSMIFVVFLFLQLSCVETVDFSPIHPEKVTVNCLLTASKRQTLSLTYSSPFDNESYKSIEQAKITLFEDGVDIGEFEKSEFNNWELEHFPKPGSTYELKVEIKDKPLIKATTVFPLSPQIRMIKKKDSYGRRYFRKSSDASVFWAFALKKTQSKDSQEGVIKPEDELFENLGTNYQYVDLFNVTSEAQGFITKPHLAYLRMLPNEESNDFFLEVYLFDCVVVFRSVSNEYDKYLKTSLEKMLVYESFDDPTQWLDEKTIYTNIENGVGIFGAYNDYIFSYGRQ